MLNVVVLLSGQDPPKDDLQPSTAKLPKMPVQILHRSGAYPAKSYKYWLTNICNLRLRHFVPFNRDVLWDKFFATILSQFFEEYLLNRLNQAYKYL
jgi:hypothetical protein